MTNCKDLYDVMECLFPPDVAAPAKQFRQVIARTAFLLALLEHREKETIAPACRKFKAKKRGLL